jgi:hypothetical protein
MVLIAALLGALVRAQATEGGEMPNLVKNGDFSRVLEGKPVGWETVGDPQFVTQELSADDGGKPCAKLVCTRCEGSGRSRQAMVAQVGQVPLEAGRFYRLSLRARAEGISSQAIRTAITDTASGEQCGLRERLRVSPSWQDFSFLFQATRTVSETGRLEFGFAEPGTLYLADVRMIALSMDEVVFTNTVPKGAGKNLVPNGSFEIGMIGWGAEGDPIAWGNLDRLAGRIESAGPAHGARFLRVPMGGGAGLALHWDYYEPVALRCRKMLAASLGWIPVERGGLYTVSCSMRASVNGARAVIGVRSQDPGPGGAVSGADLVNTVQLSTDWRRYSYTFPAKHGYVYAKAGPDLAEDVRVDVDIDAIQLEKGEGATPFEPYSRLEVGVEPSAPGGIFTEGQPASLRVRACNHAGTAARLRVEFQVRDFFDAPVELPPVSLDVPAGSLADRDVPLPADWKGYYRLNARYEAEGAAGTQSLRLAVVPPRTSDDSMLGINHAFPDAYLIQLAKKAGVTWYRDWTLKWHDLEPAPGEYHWEIGDVQVDRVLAEGAHLMALMPPYPSAKWNTTAPPEAATTGRAPRELAWAPKDPAELGKFIEKAVAHYKDRVRVWEFLNEPIYTHYALPARPGSYEPADYVRLLKVAYAAMHRADPDCKVIGGIGSSPRRLTKEVIDAGCLEHCDVFVLHIYPGGNESLPESFIPQTDALLAYMKEHGGVKPIWVTEFSYYAEDDPPIQPFVRARGSWAEDRLLANERECAEYTIRLFAIMMARGVEKFFIHAGVGGRVNVPYYDCCFFKYGGAPARLFPALAVYTELMGPAARFIVEKRLGDDGFCVAFETGKRSVLVLWRANGEAAVSVPEGAECLDLMGRAVRQRPVSISRTPIYLVGPQGAAQGLADSLKLAGQ